MRADGRDLPPVALAPCSSDIHTVYEGGVGERHNMMLGHEAVGEVVEVGSMVKDFKVGDQVIIPAITPDWSSVAAQESYAMHSGVPLGGWKFSNIKDGVFAELIHVNDADGNLAHLPEGSPPRSARCSPTWSPPDFTGLSSPASNPVMS